MAEEFEYSEDHLQAWSEARRQYQEKGRVDPWPPGYNPSAADSEPEPEAPAFEPEAPVIGIEPLPAADADDV